MNVKYVPMRMCCCCRNRFAKEKLLRVVKEKEGNFKVDESRKVDGRGAYICLEEKCFEKMLKTRALNRSFKCNVPQDVYDKLKELASKIPN